MNKPKLTVREAAVIKNVWLITTEERDKLDKFFLINDTWERVEPDLIEEDHLCTLLEKGVEYEVILISPVRRLRAAKKLGLSFRVNEASNLRVVLIKEWSDDKDE